MPFACILRIILLLAAPGDLTVFNLDPRLEQDTYHLGDLPLSRVLLSKDAHYPWFILVPRRNDVSELFDLDEQARQQLWQETQWVAQRLSVGFAADKMNVATLGNVVAQLHMHVIVRYRSDAAWPAPVWGRHPAQPYGEAQVAELRHRFTTLMGEDCNYVEARS